MESLNVTCPGCNQQFISSHFDPRLLSLPCGDQICVECFQLQIIYSQPQDRLSKFTCLVSNCGQVITVTQKFIERVTDRNFQASRCPQKQDSKIMCSNHFMSESCSLYCDHLNQLICDECAKTPHQFCNHSPIDSFISYLQGELLPQINETIMQLTQMRDTLMILKQNDITNLEIASVINETQQKIDQLNLDFRKSQYFKPDFINIDQEENKSNDNVVQQEMLFEPEIKEQMRPQSQLDLRNDAQSQLRQKSLGAPRLGQHQRAGTQLNGNQGLLGRMFGAIKQGVLIPVRQSQQQAKANISGSSGSALKSNSSRKRF